jgi:structural maintenance of chromosomes protein 5
MVVGANGTGKSTILNAICLGLGGEPKLLGRADDLRAFIMHGKDTALVEIELTPFEGKEIHVFRRSIDRNKGSEKGRGRGASTFWINGEKTNVQAVRELVGGTYNIQIDNLCTFLPQDKVGNFSGFTDQERLLETEKTLPSNQFFYHRHMELIEMEEKMNSQVSNVDSIKDTLKKKRYEFERLEIGKAHEEDRVRAEGQLELLKKKRVWLEFDQMREQCLEWKSQKDKIKEDIRVYREALAPLEEKQQRLESLHKELVAKGKTVDQNCQTANREMQKQVAKFEKHDDDMDLSLARLLELSSRRELLEGQLKDAKNKLQALEDNLASMPQHDELQQNYADSRDLMMRTKREYEGAKREDRNQKTKFSDLEEAAGRYQHKLAKMNDEGARRRENVLRSAPNLGKICEWIDGNKSRFRRPVWGPVAVEISTKSQNAASYLEFHTPNNILKAFVVETREDQNLLYSEIRDKRGIPINIISVQGSQLARTRMYSDAKMQLLKEEYGIEGYLDETFTAPDAVMIALQKYAQVEKVLVGGEKAQHSIDKKKLLDVLSEPDRALNQQGLQRSCIFTVSDKIPYRYTQSVSKYSGKVGTRVDQVGAARMLAPGVPEAQKQQAENELQQLHEEISQLRPNVQKAESAAKELEARLQECSLTERSYKQQLDNLALYQGKVSRQKQKVRDAEAELGSDETKERNDLTKSIMNRLVHGIAAVKVHGEQHKLLMKYTAQAAGINVNTTTVRAAERVAQ